MIRLQVKNPNFNKREWTDKTTGERRSMRIQQVLAYMVDSTGNIDETPDKIEVILNENQNPFEVGNYQLTPQCLYLDRNGRIQVSLTNMKLIPAQKLQSAA